MKALCWNAIKNISVEEVPDPEILNPRDAIIRVTLTAICGSDLHLYHGYIPAMKPGDILGHEFMGEVVEVGPEVRNLQPGDRVILPFPIACGACFFCSRDEYSLCDNTNPNAAAAEKLFGHSPAGIFGYSHLLGGYAGGQAEYVRVPFADVGPVKVPDSVGDEQALFVTDVFPTGWQAAEYCGIQPGDVVAVWGCGPVGQFAILSARMLGAERVIAIDRFPERLQMAERYGGAEALNYEDVGDLLDIVEALRDLTGGRGPDACIDAVGMEAHGVGLEWLYDRTKQAVRSETDRPIALRQAIMACRKGGTVSIPGVYGGMVDKIPLGAVMNKGLTIRAGQTHVQRYARSLMHRIERGEVDPSFVISHRLPLEEGPRGYDLFAEKLDDCTKVVLRTAAASH
ncbi:MAG TPA: zinc-dependent alcohol dehydrogenase [Solirubrobacterales bacterium]